MPDGLLALDFDPCPRLRSLTLAEHRGVNRLIIDPDLQAHGKPVRSLEEPVKMSNEVTTPLRELLPYTAAPEPAAVDEEDIGDPRVPRVWWKFTDREREILREKGHPGMTWPAAAVACGGSPAEGDRLRRKAKRL
ncbi:hypothetical protein VIMS_04115 [Mycobacterium marinum]|uniref:hypothetical protein n=1 Tax=Mycobacterium marinum TaxID=1781 RepID=UPI000E3C4C79|nr:hypothetical protein [Mycobacterium marinum]RFZ08684.1 hypothetical protein VIMS_04115 [Mycobacterium marinum]